MPRPRKYRRVCMLPENDRFIPANLKEAREPIILNVDEYEAIRLIDHEGFSQEECGMRMQIARSTVQQIYANARKKIAAALVEGRTLQIIGGDYRLCDGTDTYCGHGGCRCRRKYGC